ncbi:MAG: hydantoinase/oxoprolinase family protein [Chloroflexi bacterium]|nr:hydantoinase/oxoprolinase family protein [Chloroflexota bacterium]
MAYRIGIDVGGTFTDFLMVDEEKTFEIHKTLTTPADRSEGVMRGLRDLAEQCGASLADFLAGVEMIVHATTATTNAILTNTGVKTGLLTTYGFRDALEMRRGIKEEIYDNKYPHPKPLVPRRLRLPVRERVSDRGEVLAPVPEEDIQAAAARFRAHGVQAVAVCLLNSYANTQNEVVAAALLAREMPDAYVTVSTELLPEIRFYERVSTTVMNAYLGPILAGYLGLLKQKLLDAGFRGTLLIMKANGGVMSAEQAMKTATGTALSGPAAGAVAGAAYAELQGYKDCITVDMGGTSLDVALIKDGAPVVVSDASINRYRVALPMVDVHSVGAGGGSIAWIDEGGLLRVGPQSAGADPGPACYSFGGQDATVTDADLELGYLNPDYFLGGRMRLRQELAREAIRRRVAEPLGLDLLQAAAGIYQVVNVNMAAAVKEVTIKRGYDPRDFPLVVAGGAGPVHAAMIAAELEVPIIIIPRHSSIFTAGGVLLSDLKHDYTRTFFGILDEMDLAQLARVCGEMEEEGRAALASEGVSAERMEMAYALSVRYVGQYHEVEVPTSREAVRAGDLKALEGEFHRAHDRIFGYCLEGQPVELVNVRLTCVGRMPRLRFPEAPARPEGHLPVKGRRPIFLPAEHRMAEVDVWDGDQMGCGDEVHGPAVIEQVTTTILVPTGYRVRCDCYGNYVMVDGARIGGW